MLIFREWLECLGGGGHAEKPARKIAKDVYKVLKFCHPKVVTNPSEEGLLDKMNVLQYLNRLEKDGVGAEECLTKVRQHTNSRDVHQKSNHQEQHHSVPPSWMHQDGGDTGRL